MPRTFNKAFLLVITTALFSLQSGYSQNTSNHGNKFEQLGQILPSPNQYRGMDGAPGPEYWQQRADYIIDCSLDTENQRLNGEESITYYNQSPNTLRYLWLQLDENQHAAGAENHIFNESSVRNIMSDTELDGLNAENSGYYDKFGHNIEWVKDANEEALKYTINKTMMRIDLPEPLRSGETFSFKIKWHYYLVERVNPLQGGRGGYEYFPKEDNYIFTMTQWFPRMCVYSDADGWQNKQFTGRGEFALVFGNYVVNMDLPDDYVVGATGECQNYNSMLSEEELSRWEESQKAEAPVKIVTLDEAKKNAKKKPSKTRKTWIYKADNVRDFAWTASRKYIWDAMPHYNEDGKRVMCMSYYPKESYPIYSPYSTRTVAHTLKTYSKYSIPYPYPVAISVEASSGMEYPMICFNPGRAEEDGTYTERTKNRAIMVIVHEVGHNYFPMIINSDERQWAWFDEGINTFMHYVTLTEFDGNYPTEEGPPHLITDYMSLPKDRLEPIMTNSENIVDYFSNAYRKPATALAILRETIMGRELFDFAFKEYCRRWAFKHPTPADFFRTMEDASAVDLDWFWRGWFYGIDAVDISLDTVVWYQADTEAGTEPLENSFPTTRKKPFETISVKRNREDTTINFAVDEDPNLVDFYTTYKPWETEDSVTTNTVIYDAIDKKEKEEKYGGLNYYELKFSNKGGLVMPLILEWTFEDGSTEIERIPVEVWRKDEKEITKVFVKDKVVSKVILDPYKELADIDESNNAWPSMEELSPTRFQIFKSGRLKEQPNPMQKAIKSGKIIKP